MPRPKPPPECATCHAPLIFITVGRITIAAGKDPVTDGGTIAAYRTAPGAMTGRWLIKGGAPYSHEKRYQTHRCPRPPKPDPPPALFDLTDLTTTRQ